MDKKNGTEKPCLSHHQYACLIINTLVSISAFMIPSPTVYTSKQYGALSVLIGLVQAIVLGYLVVKLGLMYPDKTVIEYSQDILGKVAGKIVGLIFLLTFFSVNVLALRQFTLPFQAFVSVDIPYTVILIMTMILVVYVLAKGLKTLSICSELIINFLAIFFILLMILPMRNLDWINIKPLVPHDWGMTIKGSFLSASFLAEDIIGLMLIPYVKDKKKIMKSNQLAVLISGLCISGVTAVEILTMGYERVDSTIFSTFMLLREAQFSQTLERLESVAIAMWGGLVFIKLSLYMFILAEGFREWLGLKDNKKIGFILAPIIVICSMIPQNITQVVRFPNHVWVSYVYPIVLFALPILLLLISVIKKRGEKN